MNLASRFNGWMRRQAHPRHVVTDEFSQPFQRLECAARRIRVT
jgi:hypothetical protein